VLFWENHRQGAGLALSLCELVQVSRSLSLEEMREFVRTLFFAGQLSLHGV
jgi:hypothetical protein